MPNWYATRENVKGRLEVKGADKDAAIDASIDGASEMIRNKLQRDFIPQTKTLYYPPSSNPLQLKEDVISVSALTSENGGVTWVAGDYLLEPANEGPPYKRVHINSATDNIVSFAQGADGPRERAVAVTGSWGYSADTATAGALAEALDDSETGVDVTDASLVGVGDTLLCESEQMFVTNKTVLDSTATLGSDIAAQTNVVTVPLSDGTKVKKGEVILIDSERFYVQVIAGNNATCIRAYDGTTLAAHSSGATVYVYRTLTVVRGVNGTTAAAHNTATAISKYTPPADIVELCVGQAIFNYEQNESGQTGVVGAGESATRVSPAALAMLWKAVEQKYGRPLSRVI